MLNVPIVELLKLWGELVEAYHGVNGYGGCTAELYAYRFCRANPMRTLLGDTAEKAKRKDAVQARESLFELVRTFENAYECRVTIDGEDSFRWFQLAGDTFDHRVHAVVERPATPRCESE